MQDKKNKSNQQKISSTKKKNETTSHEFETMSQRQNRYGKGRQQNGSDGGSGNGNFSNR